MDNSKMEYWYAIMTPGSNNWNFGTTDLDKAKKLCIEEGPDKYLAMIDDSDLLNPVLIKEIHQNEF